MHSLFFWSLLLAQGWSAPLTITLDAGHGGRDRGTVCNGTQEADITLAVTHQLSELLRRDKRFRVQLTRDSDASLTLYRRAQLAKSNQSDIFLSIHVNSSPDSKAKGAEFYFQNQLPPDQESMFLAHQEETSESGENVPPITYAYLDKNYYPAEVTAILSDLLDGERVVRSSELTKALKLSWRGSRKSKSTNSVRQAPFYVLSQMRTPSALVELGFLTNGDDFRELTNPEAQKKMAEDLYRGLLAYKEALPKE